MTYVEIQDLLDCIEQERFDDFVAEAKMHGAKLRNMKRPVRARERVALDQGLAKPKPADAEADAYARRMFERLKREGEANVAARRARHGG